MVCGVREPGLAYVLRVFLTVDLHDPNTFAVGESDAVVHAASGRTAAKRSADRRECVVA